MRSIETPATRALCRGVAIACLALACRSDAERAEQGRMVNLAEHIDRLRRAENASKRPLLEVLEKAECVGAEACALKDLCVRAYQFHQSALDAITSLQQLVAKDAGPSQDELSRLRKAEQDLSRARELGERCAEEQVRAVRKVLL